MLKHFTLITRAQTVSIKLLSHEKVTIYSENFWYTSRSGGWLLLVWASGHADSLAVPDSDLFALPQFSAIFVPLILRGGVAGGLTLHNQLASFVHWHRILHKLQCRSSSWTTERKNIVLQYFLIYNTNRVDAVMEQKRKGGMQSEKNPEKSLSWPDDVTRDTGSVRQSSAELYLLSGINAAHLQHSQPCILSCSSLSYIWQHMCRP